MSQELVKPAESALMQQPSEEEQSFKLAQRQALALSQSSLVPQQFQGNVANCLIAMNMAKRVGADPLMVMQNLYIVHGKPSWSSTFLIAACNQTRRFTPIQYRIDGTGDEYGCTAFVYDVATGVKIEGPKVTWAMVKAEGWHSKNGSKWKTMPELMFRYRAASFFVKTTCPEIAMGLQTREELDDVVDVQPQSASQALAAINDELDPPADTSKAPQASDTPGWVLPVRKATLSEIRKMEPQLTTAKWIEFLPQGSMDKIETEEHARAILGAMKASLEESAA